MTDMKTSGNKEQFNTGAQRDTQTAKCRPDLVSPLALERLGWVLKRGADHYGDRNWEKGMPFSRVLASLCRHLMQFQQGDKSEDHLGQLAFNAFALLHYEEAIKRGNLPASLNDLPDYGQPVEPRPAPAVPPVAPVADPPADGESINDQIIGGMTMAAQNFEGRTVYLAGPMRGHPDFNFPAFDAARDAWLNRGWHIISPADIDRHCGDAHHGTQALFALRDLVALVYLASLAPDRRGIVMLDGWEKSRGAAAEFMVARWLGITAYRPDGRPLTVRDFLGADLLCAIYEDLEG